jgi:hypothetical protein
MLLLPPADIQKVEAREGSRPDPLATGQGQPMDLIRALASKRSGWQARTRVHIKYHWTSPRRYLVE